MIDACRERVWNVVSNVTEWPRWLPMVSKITPLDVAKLGMGCRFIVQQPKLRPATWKVTQLDPPRLFVWEAHYPGLHFIAEHEIFEDTPQSSKVRLRVTFAGLFGGVAAKLLRSVTENYLAQEAVSFKRAIETLP